ncbi:MAG: DUF814 domain-containing protein [Nanoarchaeota archaeon]|nr:DUF814 domain-containing protein [Nanoarchaeota archaeon]
MKSEKKVKFREFATSSGKIVLAGKDAESNEQLISQVGKNEDILHTANPGSPFVNIKGKANKQDIKEASIFCASKSQDWRDNKKDVKIHVFKGVDTYKIKGMKTGTFGVKKHKTIVVKKRDVEEFLEN